MHPVDIKVNIPYFPILYTVMFGLAEFSELVTKIFIVKKHNGQFFNLRLMKQNVWQEILLDTYFPHLPFDQTLFLESRYNCIWPQVLEKAYAKHLGSYENINFIPIQNILMDLTGYPVELIEIKAKGSGR